MLKKAVHIFTTVFWKVNKMLEWGTRRQISVRIYEFGAVARHQFVMERHRKTTFILNRSEEYYVSNRKDVLHRTANTSTKGGEH
jgi:hypothetical protein